MALAAFGAPLATSAQARALVEDKHVGAAAPGYVVDARRADVKNYLKFATGQNCAGCALYQGEARAQASGRLVRHRGHESVNTLGRRETSL
jgi:hypothetical protein